MRKIFPACCASTEPQSAKSMAHRVRTVIFLFMRHPSIAPLSFDHLVGSRKHVRRNRQPDLFRGLQIDDELELSWLLDRQIGWLCAFQDFIHVGGGASVLVEKVHAVVQKPPGFYKLAGGVYRGEPVLYCELCNPCS